MNSDDEAYNNCIVTSENEDSAKENAARQPKTSQRQYDLIESFTQRIDERLMSKESYDRQWDDLANELNEMGPPLRNSCEWRRVWSVHKYNRKRKLSATGHATRRRSHLGPPLSDRSSENQGPADTRYGSSESRIPVDSSYQVQVGTSSDSSQLALSFQMLDKLNEILAAQIEANNLLKKLVAILSSK